MTLETIHQFLGWCTLIHVLLLVFSTVCLIVCGNWAARIHANLFGLENVQVKQAYFQFLAFYKLAIFVFCLVPYLALSIMV